MEVNMKDKLLNEFKDRKVLLSYYCGSTAFGVNTTESDSDIIVVLDDILGHDHLYLDEEKIEFYIFGRNEWLKKMEFDNTISLYNLMYSDDICSGKLIYCDSKFKTTYEKYVNRDWSKHFNVWLESNIAYYETYIDNPILRKNYWNLYRLEEQVRRYLETNVMSIDVSNNVKEKIQVYKANFKSNSILFKEELILILDYLKGVLAQCQS
jgi:predicted nucleotidyltransferase